MNSFMELSQQEVMDLNGGWDPWEALKGLGQAIGGVAEGVAGTVTAVFSPSPASKAAGGAAIVNGYSNFSEGIYRIFN